MKLNRYNAYISKIIRIYVTKEHIAVHAILF